MKFLLDVNASGAVARWLTSEGHDVAEVPSKNDRMEDSDILAWACNAQRIIVTTDTGFEELIWREGRHHFGVLRLENLPRSQRIILLEQAIATHQADLESGAIVVALQKKSRVRRPIRSHLP